MIWTCIHHLHGASKRIDKKEQRWALLLVWGAGGQDFRVGLVFPDFENPESPGDLVGCYQKRRSNGTVLFFDEEDPLW